MRINALPLVATALLAAAASGCVVSLPATGPNPYNRPPVISAFDYNPKGTITKDQAVTFTLVAMDPEGMPLQVNWSSTKGLLSGTSGMAVSWSATKPNGELDPGLATVTAVVSDGVQTTTAQANIQVNANGEVQVSSAGVASPGASVAPASTAPSASPSASPSAAPSAAASASASPETSASPSASPSTAASASPSPSPSASASSTNTATI
jgi:hypothetical protein